MEMCSVVVTTVGCCSSIPLCRIYSRNAVRIFGLKLELFICLQELYALTSLDLSRSPSLTDQGLQNLAAMTRLRELSLAYCSQLTDESLEHISSLPLVSLDLTKCAGLTERGVESLHFLSRSACMPSPLLVSRLILVLRTGLSAGSGENLY